MVGSVYTWGVGGWSGCGWRVEWVWVWEGGMGVEGVETSCGKGKEVNGS